MLLYLQILKPKANKSLEFESNIDIVCYSKQYFYSDLYFEFVLE